MNILLEDGQVRGNYQATLCNLIGHMNYIACAVCPGFGTT